MKKFLALVCTLCLLLTALPLTALAADDDWVTLNVEMYDRSIAGFNVEDCWQLHYIQENFGNPNHIKVTGFPFPAGRKARFFPPVWRAERPRTSA